MAMEDCSGDVSGAEGGFNLKLSEFIYERMLCSFTGRKFICVEGKFANKDGIAIFFFEKTPVCYSTVKNMCCTDSALEKESVINNSTNYQCFPGENGLKMNLIFPATNKHVQKYLMCPSHIIEETAELYRSVVLPYLTRESFNLQWVYNIFDHVAETESIIYEDEDPKTGFLIIPDFKWDKKSTDNLHVLALVRTHNIKSLRDLTDEHLPILKNVNSKGTQIIQELFGLTKNQLRIYIHYLPSYYHLHVHFTNIEYQAPGINAMKAHTLESVIRNIELIPDYYKRATLTYILKETDGLYECIKKNELEEEKD